jgi:hypothetical protein
MKHAVKMTLMLNLALASVNAQEADVKMKFSGNGGPSPIDLKQPNATTGEENVAGNGTLGPFTFRLVDASSNVPQPSSTCAGVYFPTVSGAGLFRFQGGSLLNVTLTQGGDCIDFVHLVAHCTRTFKINGGTGRFKNASGVLTLNQTDLPVLFDGSSPSNPVFFSEVGELAGTISGVAMQEGVQDEQQ